MQYHNTVVGVGTDIALLQLSAVQVKWSMNTALASLQTIQLPLVDINILAIKRVIVFSVCQVK